MQRPQAGRTSRARYRRKRRSRAMRPLMRKHRHPNGLFHIRVDAYVSR